MKKLFSLLSLLLFTSLFAQRESAPSVLVTKINDSFYKLFIHNYVNMIVFTGKEGTLLVDSGFPPVDLIQKELSLLNSGKVKYLINSHSNGDHILGNAAIGINAAIISSKKCREDIQQRENFPNKGLPNLTFSDSLTIRFNDEIINLYFLPGHTGNDIVVQFQKANIVFLGDLVFPDSFPGIQAIRGGNVFLLKKSIAKILELFPKETKFILGHGRDYNWFGLKEYYEMISKTIDIILDEIKSGKSLETLKLEDPLKGWSSWNSKFFPTEITTLTWIENIYESYNTIH